MVYYVQRASNSLSVSPASDHARLISGVGPGNHPCHHRHRLPHRACQHFQLNTFSFSKLTDGFPRRAWGACLRSSGRCFLQQLCPWPHQGLPRRCTHRRFGGRQNCLVRAYVLGLSLLHSQTGLRQVAVFQRRLVEEEVFVIHLP